MDSRRPFHYRTERRLAGDIDGLSAATYNRFQYYSKLRATAPEADAALVSTYSHKYLIWCIYFELVFLLYDVHSCVSNLKLLSCFKQI